jgi:hypothetical protein
MRYARRTMFQFMPGFENVFAYYVRFQARAEASSTAYLRRNVAAPTSRA